MQEQARSRCRELSKEKKWKKGISKKQISNISEENKQRLKEYEKIIVKQKKHKKILSFFLYMV